MYLWHWPMIAYLNYLNYELNYISGFSVIILTIVLATLTWFFIEGKIRKIKLKNRIVFIGFFVIPTLIVFWISYIIIVNNGLAKRYVDNDKYSKIESALVMPTSSLGWCYQVEPQNNLDEILSCTLGSEDGTPNAIFVGDSHAGHYQDLVNTIGEKTNLKVKTLITSNCFPSLYTINSSNLGGNPDLCMAFRNEIK